MCVRYIAWLSIPRAEQYRDWTETPVDPHNLTLRISLLEGVGTKRSRERSRGARAARRRVSSERWNEGEWDAASDEGRRKSTDGMPSPLLYSPSPFFAEQVPERSVFSLTPSSNFYTRKPASHPYVSLSLSLSLPAPTYMRERERELPRAAENSQMPVIRHDLEYASRRRDQRASSREFERADARHRAILKSA